MINEAFLALYEREFAAYNRVHNISRLRDIRAEAIDSLRVLQVADLTGAQVADIGSGAGFPALFLAASLPSANFVLFEPSHKKAAFLTSIIIKAGLANARVVAKKVQDFCPAASSPALAAEKKEFCLGAGEICEKSGFSLGAGFSAEKGLCLGAGEICKKSGFSLGAGLGQFDFITSRAFAPAAEVAALCAHLCSPQTRFLLYKGSYVAAELADLGEHKLHKFANRVILEFTAASFAASAQHAAASAQRTGAAKAQHTDKKGRK